MRVRYVLSTRFMARMGLETRVVRRWIVALLAMACSFAVCAHGGGGTVFGVSVTVVHRILAQTPVGIVSTTCDQSPCVQPTVKLGPVDPATGIRFVQVTY